MRLRRLAPPTFARIALFALASLVVIVVTGALVRLTGSGLGCSDWPNCSETRFVDVSSTHTAIEQLNRLFTGVVAIAVILAVLGSLVREPRRRDLTWLSLGLVAGVIGQIVLGGVTVLVDLHPAAVQGHFLLSMVLCANGFVLWQAAEEPDGARRVPVVSRPHRRLAWAITAMTGLAILTGTVVTGTGPHGGDEDARRFGFEIGSVARVHGLAVNATIVLALLLMWRLRRHADREVLEGPVGAFVFIAFLQAAIGYAQYLTGVPVVLVITHVAGATALWLVALHLGRATAGIVDVGMADLDASIVVDNGISAG
jgi:cytochrome c oxidase assembly protein subunit 15